MTVQEGDDVELCVVLNGIPSGGLDISVEVYLGAMECSAGKEEQWQHLLITVSEICSFLYTTL